ncbi:hypothetical protein IQ270_00890 [Microcoleus sp. LEGE 07076]|uniref:hypothetical protein n=1 Tax=Microcoleus sp. LEGE 07076 TaxID=915322 RepID=UPI00188162B6|nr:hypothetical protein [Microcoleus sp. LEGE 07076]MBE9183316.1 hypothetical protein [Microcoleus sp. LEGE 07076]
MEIGRWKRLFHPTSRSDRPFNKKPIANSFQIAIAFLDYPEKGDRSSPFSEK